MTSRNKKFIKRYVKSVIIFTNHCKKKTTTIEIKPKIRATSKKLNHGFCRNEIKTIAQIVLNLYIVDIRKEA